MMMTWFDMYNEFIKNFERITQLEKDYIENLERINSLYNESIRSIERVNDLYNAFIRNHEKMNTFYEQQYENMQRLDQKWLDVFSKAWEQKQIEKPLNGLGSSCGFRFQSQAFCLVETFKFLYKIATIEVPIE
jgi:hypothetical protein